MSPGDGDKLRALQVWMSLRAQGMGRSPGLMDSHVFHGHPWIAMGSYGSLGIMGPHGLLWTPTDSHGIPRTPADPHWPSWIPMDFG